MKNLLTHPLLNHKCNKLNRCKTLVLVSVRMEKHSTFIRVRRNDITPFKKIGLKQHANELWSILALFSRFGLFNRTCRKSIPSGLMHVKETSFSTKRKVVKDY